jgi:hypothetical protein
MPKSRTKLAAVWPPTACAAREGGHKPQSPLQAIHEKCRDCSCPSERPYRQHRFRLARSAEIEQHEILDGPIAAPTGCRVFVTVKNIAPAHRLRLFVLGIEGSETDLSEEACAIYEMPQTDKSREVEEAMRQLAKDWP